MNTLIGIFLSVLFILWVGMVFYEGIRICFFPDFSDMEGGCSWCGVYGFCYSHNDHGRKYKMCKWCLKMQNEGGKVEQCQYEICRKCNPTFDGSYPEKVKKDVILKERKDLRITLNVGHPCGICGTTMVLFEPKVNPMQPIRERYENPSTEIE